ncbi:MAG TPA: glycoside hydrolase family 13 protein [Bacteroidales bacterium]|nr:glycoside hydrolase family 13 protein [Bacteroidales bacterium]
MKTISVKIAVLLVLGLMTFAASAQYELSHVEPPLWWTGMRNPELMLTIHGKNISDLTPRIQYKGISIKTVTRSENRNFLFLTLHIDTVAPAGTVNITFVNGKKTVITYPYELRGRKSQEGRSGYSSADVIYLLMPDRFANGDTTNDSVDNLHEKLNRKDLMGRHGGDIKGIIDHLDYLQNLGITALWTTPLLEDNQPEVSYHTYAITDYYKVDGRYGTNGDYVKLADECHKRGIKLIMDMVPNHCGSAHWWMKDKPMSDWFHEFPEFTRSNYTIATWNDPHASQFDKMINEKGWFDTSMPDLNQTNPFVLTYFKQFAIFWIEYAGLDGLRVDTYPYNDKYKIADWTQAIRYEYPWINIVGECWQHRPEEIAYWQTGSATFDGYDSQLPTVMDFPLQDAFMSWNLGSQRFYEVYVLDYVYANPKNILVFLDNHDTQRFSQQIGFDINKYKLSVAHLLTTRGIPQIYYGTEILMGGEKSKGDGDIRHDFPGGWPGDERNAFTEKGRTPQESEAFNFTRALLNYRKLNPVLSEGKMIHFLPRDNVYVYFRMYAGKTVMVALNFSNSEKKTEVSRFDECLKGSRKAKEIFTGKPVDLNQLSIPANEPLILEIQ